MVAVSKYQSYGNDFVALEASAVPETEWPEFSAAVCDRHFGIGADGCLFVTAEPPQDFFMVLYNQDGSRAAMSGNGGRCACSYLHHKQLASASTIPLRSSAGLTHFTLLKHTGSCWRYRSEMGLPDFDPARLPAAAPAGVHRLLDYPLTVDGQTVRINCLWVGNPQCILMVDRLPEGDEFERLGEALATHDFFPEGTNVGFATVGRPAHLTLKIWERGVGPTWSSGTGSCASAVVAIERGLTESPTIVETETGSQCVEWTPGAPMWLEGQTRFVADCQFQWPA